MSNLFQQMESRTGKRLPFLSGFVTHVTNIAYQSRREQPAKILDFGVGRRGLVIRFRKASPSG